MQVDFDICFSFVKAKRFRIHPENKFHERDRQDPFWLLKPTEFYDRLLVSTSHHTAAASEKPLGRRCSMTVINGAR